MILFAYALAGHGHRMAALALEEELTRRGEPVPSEVLDILKITPRRFAHSYAGIYWWLVHYMPVIWLFFFWLFNLKPIHALDQLLKKHLKSGALGEFEKILKIKQPKQIVFTHYLGIHNAVEMKKRGEITSFVRAVVTDFYAHALWINPGVDEYNVMCKETRDDMIQRWNIDGKKIRITGIPVFHKFLQSHKDKKQFMFDQLGLQQNRITLLFTSGSFGYGPTDQYLHALAPFHQQVQAIVVCGENIKRKSHLEGEGFPFPVAVLGFVQNMEELMDISDLLVAKPGGITTCEALVKGVPMMVSSIIPGQEEGNLRVLEKYNACWRLYAPDDIVDVIKEILEFPDELNSKRKMLAVLAKPHASRDIVDQILKTS